MQVTRFLVTLLAVTLLVGPGCGHDASFHGKEASPLSFDVVVLGDTLSALVCALEAAEEGAAVMLLHGQSGDDTWLLEQGAAAAVAAPPEKNDDEADETETAAEMYTESDLRQDLNRHGGVWGQTWHYDLLADGAYDALTWFAMLLETPLEQDRPGLFRLPRLGYAQAYAGLVQKAGQRGVRFIEEAVVETIDRVAGDGCFILQARVPGDRAIQITARAVVMAQGGYLKDQVLMQEIAAGVHTVPWRSAGAGEALRLAIALNLDLVQLDCFAYDLAVQEGGNWVKAHYPERALLIVAGQALPLSGMTAAEIITVLLRQEKNCTGYVVVAETRLEEAERERLDWVCYPGIDSFFEVHFPELLAPPGSGFDRPGDNYYGTPIAALAEYCLGGIAINEEGQVLRAARPVTGLFALGEAAGGLHGQALLPGAALSETLVWGRRTGAAAARMAQQ